MKILQISPHFYPNIGGVETHLLDLIKALEKRNLEIFVVAYQPLSHKADWKIYEKIDRTSVLRIPWLAGQFYKLVTKPALEFLYLLPGIFLVTPFIILSFDPDVINAHGLVAGFVAVIWGRLFGKRVVVSLHNIYHFPKAGLYRTLVKWIFNNASVVLNLSNQSVEEIRSLGILAKKVKVFTYWIDLNQFKRIDNAKTILGWEEKFVVLFIGRLVTEKGVLELITSAKQWNKKIYLVIVGTGPLSADIENQTKYMDNLIFVGAIDNKDLQVYYSAADLLVVPSIHEEGFGRVILEALACGTPVIGSKRGAIVEAMDNTVGRVIDINAQNIKDTVEYFYSNKTELKKISNNCRKFAERRYSEKNVETIVKAYREEN